MHRIQQLAVSLSGLFLTAGVLTACGMTTDAEPVAKAQPDAQVLADTTYLVECTPGKKVQQPTTFTLACGDGNAQLTDLKWERWGDKTATATGSVTTNNCLPNCAEGKNVQYAVQVTAKDAITTGPNQAYTTLDVQPVEKSADRPHEIRYLHDLAGNRAPREDVFN